MENGKGIDMQVDGSVVMWAFGLVFVAFSGLMGVIWAMLNRRLTGIEEQAKSDRIYMQQAVQRIYDELTRKDQESEASDRRILQEITAMREAMAALATAAGERRASCVERFATKDDLRDLRKEVERK